MTVDVRMVILLSGTLVIASGLLAACSGPSYPAPMPMVHTRAGTDPSAGPDTPEARAQAVLTTLTDYCVEHGDVCAAQFSRPADLPPPDVEVAEVERRFLTTQAQEVRTLGFLLRWDPANRRIELERGNTPTFRGDPASDP